MSNTETPETVLAAIPGWQDADYRELAGGQTNNCYLVETDARRGVLKIDAAPRSAPYNRRVDEARVQRRAASVGLANAVLHADETSYLTEYVDGRVWSRDDLDDDDNLIQLAGALRRLHGLPLTGRAFDAKSAARQYIDKLDAAEPVIAERFIEIIESMPQAQNLCCCHNDLVAENIISTPDMRFLDWEYACDNDPLFDLATIVAHHELSDGQAELLLDAYFDGDGARWREKFAAQERLYDALHWLWAASRQTDRA